MKKKALFFIPWLLSTGAFSQAPLSDEWNKLDLKSTFLSHPVLLRMAADDTISLGNSTLSYFSKDADFREVTSPEVSSGFNINSKRFVAVKDWRFFGEFSFSRYTDKGTQYTVHADPQRENPYKIADAIASAHWKKQQYLLDARIVTPEIVRNLRAGLRLNYNVLNGARQVDPRPADRAIDLGITPQLMYQLKKWDVGVFGHYNRFREDLSISIQNNQLSKNIYKQLGLGEYLYNGPILLSGGLSRLYEGNTYGTGVSFGKRLTENNYVQLTARYNTHSESATDGTSTPFNAGQHERKELGAQLTYERNGESSQQVFAIDITQRKSENTEFIQFLNNETLQYEVIHSNVMHWQTKRQASLSYQVLLLNNEGKTSWQLGASNQYFQTIEKYPSTSSDSDIAYYFLAGSVKKSFHWKHFSLTIGYQTNLKKVLDSQITFFANPKTDNYVASKIMYPNYYFQTTDAWSNKAEVQVTFPTFEKKNVQLYFKADFENTASLNTPPVLAPHSLSNQYFNFTIGLFN